MKKLLALALTLALLLSLFSVASAEKAPGSVNLSIMLALGQWTDNFDELIEAYKAENPQIGTIEYEFPSSSVYPSSPPAKYPTSSAAASASRLFSGTTTWLTCPIWTSFRI